ncbi:2-hydroxyacid dehydrogenase [Ottowia thiooxydans]|uniref:2-hydroxyacid dehydrogenase n=1 Tax=Ottowia thiooxydans TaxID=219182 RepID=UPI00048FEF7C|nr:glyoxylate/hydroxypyruvate reductase A [Ottowia thiooxydans]
MRRVLPFVCPPSYPFWRQWVAALQEAMPDEHVVVFHELDARDLASCDVAVVANPSIEDLRALPNLKWVHSVWAGVERLVADLGDLDLKIVRLVDPVMAETMSEAVLAWTLYLHRDMPRYAKQQASREWLEHEYVGAGDKTVSLLGLGALGTASAVKLRGAGFQVCGWSRTRKSISGVQCYAGEEELLQMLGRTDILVCLLPLTSKTEGILSAEVLGALPQGASIINFARGPVVDEHALRRALDESKLSHAVLDVFNREPLPVNAWQWAHPRVTVLPHISGPTNRRTASALAAANILNYRTTGVLPISVDRKTGY